MSLRIQFDEDDLRSLVSLAVADFGLPAPQRWPGSAGPPAGRCCTDRRAAGSQGVKETATVAVRPRAAGEMRSEGSEM